MTRETSQETTVRRRMLAYVAVSLTLIPGGAKWLGLAPVCRIVKQNGGSIEVDSVPGKGTTVRIYLLRIAPDAEAGMAQTIHKVLDMPASDNVQTGG